MFLGVIYVAWLALREQLSRLGKASFRCKRKNNALRSERVRSAVVVFAFVLSARNVSGRYLCRMARQSDICSRSVNSFRGSATYRFAVNTKTIIHNPNTFVLCLLFLCPAYGSTPPSPCRYFLTLGASIMFIFLPSSFGIISTLANSSRSVAKRSSRISPCSLKTIERPRKKT